MLHLFKLLGAPQTCKFSCRLLIFSYFGIGTNIDPWIGFSDVFAHTDVFSPHKRILFLGDDIQSCFLA